MNFLPCVANERNRESFHYVEFTKPKCLLVYTIIIAERNQSHLSPFLLSVEISFPLREKRKYVCIPLADRKTTLLSNYRNSPLLSPRVSTPSRCIDAIFFIGGENTRREKVFLLLLSPHHVVVEGEGGRCTGWNGLNNVNYPAKRVGGPCIYPCRVAPAKIEENRGPSERGGWGGGRRSEGGEKERSAGLVRVSATLLARSTNPRPRRSQSDRLLGHPLPSPSTMAHDAAKRRASLSARIFLGLIRPLGTRFPTSII